MVIPKKRQLKMGIIVPVFAAVLLVISTSSGVVVGAISPGLLKLIDPSSRESSTSQNRSDNISRNDRRVDRSSDSTKTGQAEQVKVSKQEAQSVTPAKAKNSQSAAAKPKAAPVAPTVSRDEAVPPSVPDTAVASKQLSSEQTKKSVQPVQYQSAKISTDQRNELLQVSLIVASAAGIFYVFSYAGVVWRLIYGDPNPARHTIIQQ